MCEIILVKLLGNRNIGSVPNSLGMRKGVIGNGDCSNGTLKRSWLRFMACAPERSYSISNFPVLPNHRLVTLSIYFIALLIAELCFLNNSYATEEECQSMQYSIEIIDEVSGDKLAGNSFDSLISVSLGKRWHSADKKFRSFVESLSNYVFEKVKTECREKDYLKPTVNIFFVYRPMTYSGSETISDLRQRIDKEKNTWAEELHLERIQRKINRVKINADLLAKSIHEAKLQATSHIDSPWAKVSVRQKPNFALHAVFFWSEPQVLIDQAVLAGVDVSNISADSIDNIVFKKYIQYYENAISGELKIELGQTEILEEHLSKHIPAHLLLLLYGNAVGQEGLVSWDGWMRCLIENLMKLNLPQLNFLIQSLFDRCIKSISLQEDYKTILDTKPIFNTDKYGPKFLKTPPDQIKNIKIHRRE